MKIMFRQSVLVMAAVGALVAGPMMSGLALADNKHVAEAIEHAKEAVAHGKQGHADALVKHAEGALHHAEAAQKDVKNPHLDEGVKHLKEAVEHGKAGHRRSAGEGPAHHAAVLGQAVARRDRTIQLLRRCEPEHAVERDELAAVEPVSGGYQATWEVTVVIDGEERPACIAEMLLRWYV